MRVSGYNIILLILLITISGISQEIKYPPGSGGGGGGGGNNFNPNQFETNNLQVTIKTNAGVTNLNVYNNLDVKGTAYLRGNQTGAGLFVNTYSYVGIGTTNPTYPLHVTGSASIGGNTIVRSVNNYANIYGYYGSSLSYRDASNNTPIGLLLRSTDGYVSINSLNPKSRLDVHGSIGTGGAGVEYPQDFTNAIVLTNTIGLSATSQLTNTVAIYATNGWLVARSPQNQGMDSHLIGWATMYDYEIEDNASYTNSIIFPTYGYYKIEVNTQFESISTNSLLESNIRIVYGVNDYELIRRKIAIGGANNLFPSGDLTVTTLVNVPSETERVNYYKIITHANTNVIANGRIIIQRIR